MNRRAHLGSWQYALIVVAAVAVVWCSAATSTGAASNAGQQRRPAARAAARAVKTSIADGVYTPEQAKRGEAVYVAECAHCHRDDLLGGDCVPSLAGPAFYDRWSNKPVSDLYEALRKTMPLGAEGSLNSQEYSDIIGYVLSFNELPAGDTELPTDVQKLTVIKIQEKKK